MKAQRKDPENTSDNFASGKFVELGMDSDVLVSSYAGTATNYSF